MCKIWILVINSVVAKLPVTCILFLQGSPVSTLVNPGESEPLCLMPTSQDNTLLVKVCAAHNEHVYSCPYLFLHCVDCVICSV